MNSIGRNRFSKFYFLGIVVLVCLIIYSFSQSFVNNDYAYSDFLTDLKANNIKQLTIKQNKEVPTGKLVIKLSNSNESKIVYVTDVNKVISDIDKAKADNNKIRPPSRAAWHSSRSSPCPPPISRICPTPARSRP